MVMRYHWGLGIGHTYSHGIRFPSHASTIPHPSTTHGIESSDSDDHSFQDDNNGGRPDDDDMEDTNDPEDGELGMSAQDEDLCFDTESELGSEEWQDVPEEDDDEEFLEIHDMYHTEY